MATNIVDNRVNFASVHNPLPYPDFLDVQLKSFKDFLQLDTPPEERKNDGLYKVFAENFPITDTRNNFVLEFLDYYIDPPRYTIDECLERGLTYSVPLKDRKSTRLNSSHANISYAVFCLKKKNTRNTITAPLQLAPRVRGTENQVPEPVSVEIGRAHVLTPVTPTSRMQSCA